MCGAREQVVEHAHFWMPEVDVAWQHVAVIRYYMRFHMGLTSEIVRHLVSLCVVCKRPPQLAPAVSAPRMQQSVDLPVCCVQFSGQALDVG